MERLELNDASMGECVQRAAAVLARGGVIIYPTDTLYGLGADAFSDEAVGAVYAIKGRNENKPIHCVVADMEMAGRYAEVSDDARLLAKEFFPGALTLVLSAKGGSASGGKKKPEFGHGIGRYRNTIGIRIPDNEFCLSLAREFGQPFTTTSANAAGKPHAFSINGILEQLGAVAARIDLTVDAGDILPRMASTVVDLSGEEPVILREGAIPVADVWNAIRAEA
ncbi:MAG TPA: L-threonylcarbamoyladenylate synthase [Candidatus Paceibacterota bacterium]